MRLTRHFLFFCSIFFIYSQNSAPIITHEFESFGLPLLNPNLTNQYVLSFSEKYDPNWNLIEFDTTTWATKTLGRDIERYYRIEFQSDEQPLILETDLFSGKVYLNGFEIIPSENSKKAKQVPINRLYFLHHLKNDKNYDQDLFDLLLVHP